MTDLEIDDDFRAKFAYLFKPITDFVKGFEIDLIEVLRDYDSKTLEAETGFNFVNAAAMLQGTTNVYGKRVDILHKAVQAFNDPTEAAKRKQAATKSNEEEANNNADADVYDDIEDAAVEEPLNKNKKQSRLNQEAGNNEDANQSNAENVSADEGDNRTTLDGNAIIKVNLLERLHRNIAKATLEDNNMIVRDPEEGLCIFDRFTMDECAHYPMYVTIKREYSLMYTMPGNMMPLLQEEKRPIELFDSHKVKFGDIDDYRMCRDYIIYNFSIFSNLGGKFCYEIQENHCVNIAEQFQQLLKSSDGSNLPENCITEIERTLEADMKRGRPSHHLIELCRRVSEGVSVHRLSEGLEDVRLKSSLASFENEPVDNYESFSSVDLPDREPIFDVSVQSEGPVTRSSTRTSRRTTTSAPVRQVEFNDGTFHEYDLYEETEYCYNPVKVVKRVKVASRKAQRMRVQKLQKNNGKVQSLVEEIADYFADDCEELRVALERNMADNNISFVFQEPMVREKERRTALQQEQRRAHMQALRGRRVLQRNSEEKKVVAPLPVKSKSTIDALEQSMQELVVFDAVSMQNMTTCSIDTDPVTMKDVMNTDANNSYQFANFQKSIRQSYGSNKEDVASFPLINADDDETDYVSNQSEMQYPDTDEPLFADLPENSTIQNVVRVFLSRKWHTALKKQPECAVKLAKWEHKMYPILNNLTDDFAAHKYGSQALEEFDSDVGRTLFFDEVARGKSHERSRYLLSLLMLSNRDVVSLHSAHNGFIDEKIDVDDVEHEDFKIELVDDAAWHGNEMNKSGLI